MKPILKLIIRYQELLKKFKRKSYLRTKIKVRDLLIKKVNWRKYNYKILVLMKKNFLF